MLFSILLSFWRIDSVAFRTIYYLHWRITTARSTSDLEISRYLAFLPHGIFTDGLKYIERRRHLFFGLVRTFHVEILILAATSAVIVLGKFVVPIGLNNLLQ
jgi:hypothetical protein